MPAPFVNPFVLNPDITSAAGDCLFLGISHKITLLVH
uniref:Uncharacterized protein n=1 Tax=Anguilla anguilla TaxID=7936 RepID=A0A0E9UZF9_ANGAN